MAYDANKPANDDFIADAPQELRTNFDGLKNDQLVNAGLLNGLKSGNAQGNIPVSNGTVNTGLNADKLDGNDASAFANVTHGHTVATGSSDGFMANTDKQKIDTVATGAEVNQNAFSNVQVGDTTIQADSKTDTLEIVAGTNISVVADAVNDRLTFSITGKVASAASADYATSAGSAPANGGTASYLSNFSVTGRSDADVNSYTTSGMFAFSDTPANAPLAYAAGISACNTDVGLQIAGGYTSDELFFRGWWNYGAGFSTWRSVVHSGNIASQSVNYATTAGSAPANGGTATYAPNSSKLFSTDSSYQYGGGSQYYGYLTYNNGVNRWRFQVSPATPAGVEVAYADSAGSAGSAGSVPWSGVTGAPSSTAYDAGHSFATNGWQKLSNGLILQWGYVSVVSVPSIATFPIAFPNSCLNINFKIINAYCRDQNVVSYSTTGASFAWTGGAANLFWQAIGY